MSAPDNSAPETDAARADAPRDDAHLTGIGGMAALQSEAGLDRAQERMLRAQDLGGVYPFEWYPAAGGFAVTAGFRALLGLGDDDERLFERIMARIRDSDRSRIGALAEAQKGDPRAFEREVCLIIADGSERWFLARGRPIPAEPGGPAGLVGVLIDITQRKLLEQRLKDSEAELRERQFTFRMVADAMPQMVWSTRPDGFHDYYNARWYEFTGMRDGSTDGEGWNGMFHPDDQARAWARWSQSLATGEPYEIEYRLRHHTGDYRWVLGRALAVRDDAGQIIRWFGTCTDIHETRKAAEYVELLSQELSHRIKNIFAIIQSLIGLSARRVPESRVFAQDLHARVAALGRAHDLARPHSEQSRPQQGAATLHALAREILRPYLAMDDGRITLAGEDVAIDDAAATPFALILHELATNAKKYGALSTDTGQVRLVSARDDQTCVITWEESGGPALSDAPVTEGFGTRLMSASAQSHLNGTIKRHWKPEGVVVTVTCPLSSLRRAVTAARRPQTA